MITEQEANDLMDKLLDLRTKFAESKDPKIETQLHRHENICMDKFRYLVSMRTGRYKNFANYEDLNQEGFVALLKAMKTYKSKKGNFFAWAHKYITTRISRAANQHTTIRYPLAVAKDMPPHKELVMPTQIEEHYCPDVRLEVSEDNQAVKDAIKSLSRRKQRIIKLAFGFNGEKPMSINKLSKKFGIPRIKCVAIIDSALLKMKERIKL